jgi:hypothetical protein
MSRQRELEVLASRLGWKVEGINGRGHVRLIKPGCKVVIAATTPSCWRWRRNVLAQLRRAERREIQT